MIAKCDLCNHVERIYAHGVCANCYYRMMYAMKHGQPQGWTDIKRQCPNCKGHIMKYRRKCPHCKVAIRNHQGRVFLR